MHGEVLYQLLRYHCHIAVGFIGCIGVELCHQQLAIGCTEMSLSTSTPSPFDSGITCPKLTARHYPLLYVYPPLSCHHAIMVAAGEQKEKETGSSGHANHNTCNQGLIYSFGEEGMQLVQPSKFFSVTIFRTRSIGSIGMRTCELELCCYF